MKKIWSLIAIAVISAFTSTSLSATTRVDSNGETVCHYFLAVAQYRMSDFDVAKESSMYGLGLNMTSISHWGKFHVGANVNFSINAGLIKDWGCIIDFGPSARYDISKNVVVNMPINAVCVATFPEGGDTQYNWGMGVYPSLHVFANERLGFFAGPAMTFSFSGNENTSIGFQAGISYQF